jgi:LEA14-like dessication related protein
MAVLVAAALLLGGCAGLGLRTPTVSLADVRVIEAGLFEQRLGIKLRIINPNNDEIPVNGLTFEVDINGEPFAKGVSDRALTVPRLGEAVLDVTAVTGVAGIIRQIQGLARGNIDSISYRIKGRIITGTTSFGLDFDEMGRLEMPRAGQGR